MANRKRKADEDGDGDENMSTLNSPAAHPRSIARPSKKVRSNDITGRPLTLSRLLETLDTDQLRTVLERICESHPLIGHEVVTQAPRPSVDAALAVLRRYQDKLTAAIPYGNSSAEYTYCRVKEPLIALTDAVADFTPQFLPPTETQPTKSLEFLDQVTKLIHALPDWEPQAYRHHKNGAYDDISRAWALVISEAGKRAGGFNLHSDGWDQALNRHNDQSRGRLAGAISAMASSVGWMGTGPNQSSNDQNSILNQLMSGSYGSPVRVGPWPGEQHKPWTNPYEEKKPRISEWTAKDIATISLRLDKQLGPEYISSRAGPGGSRVHYLTADKCISLANEIFGFNGWSSSIQNIQVDFADENAQTQRVSIGLSVIVRITLRDGTYHEDIGYGSIENARGKAMAFEKAKKEGTTDALKRTLRSFGNVLGNCIYDQEFVKQVTKIKAQPVKKFDEDNLHRHAGFVRKDVPVAQVVPAAPTDASEAGSGSSFASAAAAAKVEASESFEDFLGDFDEADFCVSEEGHPDEVVVPVPAVAKGPQTRQQQDQRQASKPVQQRNHRPQPPQTPNAQHQRQTAGNGTSIAPPAPPAGEPVAAFFSARAVATDANQTSAIVPNKQQFFNPKAESPSIRKTPGIDHSSSKPLSRTGQHVPPPSQAEDPSAATPSRPAAAGRPHGAGGPSAAGGFAPKGHVVNPSLDQARRIGAPGGPASPLANRNSYKPPTMKRPLGQDGNAPRVPLSDIPSNGPVVAGADGLDTKRQRMA
ncbi:RAD52 DNA repair protein RADC [Cordyceps militaris CM01]|uniref:Tethering factor for nuclear proteasome STS1 n=1 Tax=Cordyceps militaris (strain CM01) TaxID=983644 RepID=G3JR39_CORMM|nr:RAD52 DNA repair protein RADC [Cordyceps militaris CM01]EGX88335.1 RAD52 DNA repair protein RADC [Cordyceps militaris CM01]